MNDYNRVARNIINTARVNNNRLDLLTITPYTEWWRHSDIKRA
jgi:hypothetical protein